MPFTPFSWRGGARLALFSAGLALVGLSPACAEISSTVVYESGTEGYHTFRIPSILRAANGDLLAFAEGRKSSRSDTGDIDLLLKRSSDGGKTWGPLQVLWDNDGNTCGNPCPVLDEKTGNIVLLSTHNLGVDKEHAIIEGTSEAGRTVWLLQSSDHGATWSKPVDITASTKRPDWTWYATGPGVGIQIKNGPHAGRLVIPSDHNYNDPVTGESKRASHAIYSDDGGAKWQIGGTIKPEMNECQVVELFDGSGTLLMDMRSYRGLSQRAQSRSTDGGETWSEAVNVPELVEPICQASILRWENAGGHKPGWVIFSNPAHPNKRRNLTVRASPDNGATWPLALTIYPGGAAYSCLVTLSEDEAGCFYELSDDRPYQKLVFARFRAVDLTAR